MEEVLSKVRVCLSFFFPPLSLSLSLSLQMMWTILFHSTKVENRLCFPESITYTEDNNTYDIEEDLTIIPVFI